MRLLYVPLSDQALKGLIAQAEGQRRRPQDEAAILLEQALGLRPMSTRDIEVIGDQPSPAAKSPFPGRDGGQR